MSVKKAYQTNASRLFDRLWVRSTLGMTANEMSRQSKWAIIFGC